MTVESWMTEAVVYYRQFGFFQETGTSRGVLKEALAAYEARARCYGVFERPDAKWESRELGVLELDEDRVLDLDMERLELAGHNLYTTWIPRLARIRRAAVHPPAAWAAPVAHPVFKLGMEPRFVIFRAENAVNAQWFARMLIAVCVRKPQKKYLALGAWCEPLVELVPEPKPRPEWETTDGETVIT